MQPLVGVLPQALAAVLRNAPFCPEKLELAWRTAVGPGLDRATTVHLAGTVLQVRARDDAWRREVTRSLDVVRLRLDVLLGAGTVTRIDVIAG